MRKKFFRVLAGIIGLLTASAGIIESRIQVGSSFWPSWLLSLTMFLWTAFFLWFAFTGRPWSASYDRKIRDKDDKLNDR